MFAVEAARDEAAFAEGESLLPPTGGTTTVGTDARSNVSAAGNTARTGGHCTGYRAGSTTDVVVVVVGVVAAASSGCGGNEWSV